MQDSDINLINYGNVTLKYAMLIVLKITVLKIFI